MLGDRQVTRKGRVPVFFIDRLFGGDAAGVYKELLETFPTTEFPQSLGVTVIKVLVGDKDVIVNRFGVFKILAEEIGVERKIDITQDNVKCAAPPPS